MSPRVGISLLTLVPGISGGTETYVRELLPALGRVGELEYRALVPSIASDIDGVPIELAGGYHAARTTPRRLAAMIRAAAWPRAFARHLEDVDLVHYPLTVPIPRTRLPGIVTLHDVQHLDMPELFSRGERAFRRLAYDRAARNADAVIVKSEFVRARAVERLRLDPTSVHVIPDGLNHSLFRPGDDEREEFLLYPAMGWPHKNHARLFEAFALLRRHRPALGLVLTGYSGSAPDGVRVLGRVPFDVLAHLYRTAAVVVVPSLYEGLGLPPLEAMACGCPVACSNAAALPEVCGDAAALFDPTDPEAIAAGVEEALERADELRRRGLSRSAEFTWERAAAEHEAVYRSTLP